MGASVHGLKRPPRRLALALNLPVSRYFTVERPHANKGWMLRAWVDGLSTTDLQRHLQKVLLDHSLRYKTSKKNTPKTTPNKKAMQYL